jgi:hypothetical protein
MTNTRLVMILCAAMFAGPSAAQTPARTPLPAAPPPPAAQKPAPRPQPPQRPAEPAPPEAPRAEATKQPERTFGQPVNIRIEVTLIDEGGPQPSRKTVSVTVADRQSGQVRSAVSVLGIGHVPLALDALPILERDGTIRTRITLEYQPNPGGDRKEPTPVEMRLSFGLILHSGQKIVAAQAADPVTDRRVSAEVTATVLK